MNTRPGTVAAQTLLVQYGGRDPLSTDGSHGGAMTADVTAPRGETGRKGTSGDRRRVSVVFARLRL
ncbi:hypothetical protein [Streptomyces spirodelae]|uniref:Uncharacterized protein n=1 Tax=Streptomyces spirodelae TaxID=2812904 RepID=A0ABS3WX96_9ACTN|nr:hypothetical protein [Streptomyces spirodelae]MBO8187755.1 hypothetical protein [Streptomyces spirodelae]